MNTELQKLLILQEIDLKILQYSKEKTKFLLNIKNLESKFLEKKKLFDEKYRDFKQKEIEVMELNLELKSKEEEYKKYQKQRMEVTTPKQLKAIDTEMINTKKIMNELEDKILILMENLETQKKNIETEKKSIEEEEAQINETKQKGDQTILEISEKENDCIKKRELILNDIDKNLLSIYKKASQSKDGIGIVIVKNNACGGCFLELPPQIMVRVMRQEDIVTCPSCSRILYYSPEE